jgi:hypothetical protein
MTSLVKYIHDNANKAIIEKNSHYVFITADGKLVDVFNDICYARLKNTYNCKKKGIRSIRLYFNQHKRDNVDEKAFKAYFKWITKESPWAKGFKSTRNWEKDGISMNCDMPLQYVGGAATALREGYEFPTATLMWWKMVKEYNINPALAHILSNFFTHKHYREGYFTKGGKGHHGALSHSLTKKGIKAYLGNSPNLPKSSTKSNAESFSGIWKLFDAEDCYNLTGVMQEFIQPLYKKQGKGWDVVEALYFDDKFIKAAKQLEKEVMSWQ